MRRFGNASPERAKVWTEPQPKHHPQHQRGQLQGRKVPVVYYLCRNRHLEHPHFIEVLTSSPEGLFLRDVINRLNALRGKGVTASYSWSCKRSYKTGFVWHDLSEDDLVLPTNGDEYVLKGSEILNSSSPGPTRPAAGNPKQPPQPEISSPSTSRSQETSPSSGTAAVKEMKLPPPLPQPPSPAHPPAPATVPEDELSPSMANRPCSFSGNTSPSPGEYRVHKTMGAADAATQTEEAEAGGGPKRTKRPPGAYGRTVSTEEFADLKRNRMPRSTRSCELIRDDIASPLTSTSTFSPNVKIDTLESLIRADAARNLNSFRILEEEIPVATGSAKMKPINVLMQLITCGSISVKGHHSLGLIPRYRPAFSHAEFPSPPAFSGTMMMGELSGMPKSPRVAETRPEERKTMGTPPKEGEGGGKEPALKGASPNGNGGDWSPRSPLPSGEDNHRAIDLARSERFHKNSKKSGAAPPPRSPLLSSPRFADYQQSPSWDASRGSGSLRMPVPSASKGSSQRVDSFQKEKVIKIEERLTSGARVIIQSTAPCADSDGSSEGS